jgi:hypothetical protein
VASAIGGPPAADMDWDQEEHDPFVAELVGQRGGECPAQKAPGREQQTAKEWLVGRAGQ